MKSLLVMALVSSSAAGSLTLKAGSGMVQISTESGALKFGATCIDRSNWCGEWADTACSADANAVKGGQLAMGSGGPALQSYSDGTLAFESLGGGGCVGILETTPTAAQLQENNQVVFGTTGRIYKDSAEKLWIQAGSLVDSASVVLVPPTAAPTAYPTKAAPTAVEATAQTSTAATTVTLDGIAAEQFTPEVQLSVQQAAAAEYEVHLTQVTVEIDDGSTRRRLTEGLALRVTIQASEAKAAAVKTEMQAIADTPALQDTFVGKINQFLKEEAVAKDTAPIVVTLAAVTAPVVCGDTQLTVADVTLSSTHWRGSAAQCIDGIVGLSIAESAASGSNLCHTNKEEGWIKLDLGSVQSFDYLKLWQTKDFAETRFGSHTIATGDSADGPWTTCFTGKLPASWGPHTEACKATARHVMISLDGHEDFMHLEEIQVLANGPGSTEGCGGTVSPAVTVNCGRGSSGANTCSVNGQCASLSCPSTLKGCDYQSCGNNDQFDIDTTNPAAPTATRTTGQGWGMDLHFTCTCNRNRALDEVNVVCGNGKVGANTCTVERACASLTCPANLKGCDYPLSVGATGVGCGNNDQFDIDTTDPAAPTATRTDSAGNGWNMDLQFTCTCNE
jgi:hypothetical protein